MKILLTGACGLVGKAIRQAAGDQHTFVNIDLNPEVLRIGGIQASFADREVVRRAAEGCDAIIHTAAAHGSGYGKTPNEEYIRVNVIGTDHLLAAAREHGIRRVVCSSTLEVLCGVDWTASGPRRYRHDDSPRPDWIYPLSKLMVEQLGSLYHREYGMQVAQLRYSWVREVPMRKIGYGLLARSVAAQDVADANLRCLTSPYLQDDVLLITSGSPITEEDIILAQSKPWEVLERHWPGCRAVLEAAGYPAPRWEEFWPIGGIEQARRVLGWEPKVTFTALLQELGWTRPAADVSSVPAASQGR